MVPLCLAQPSPGPPLLFRSYIQPNPSQPPSTQVAPLYPALPNPAQPMRPTPPQLSASTLTVTTLEFINFPTEAINLPRIRPHLLLSRREHRCRGSSRPHRLYRSSTTIALLPSFIHSLTHSIISVAVVWEKCELSSRASHSLLVFVVCSCSHSFHSFIVDIIFIHCEENKFRFSSHFFRIQ